MKANHRYYILLLVAILSTVVSIFVYVYLYKKTVSQAAESAQSRAADLEASKQEQYETDVEKTYESSAEERARIGGYLVSQEKIITFIEAVESIGTTTNVRIDLSALDSGNFNPESGDDIGNLKTHIDIQGEWGNVMRALTSLENMPYSISLNNIRLVRAGETSTTINKKDIKVVLWNMSIDLRTLITK